MSTVAFLASVVDPRVASAAAKAALGECLMKQGDVLRDAFKVTECLFFQRSFPKCRMSLWIKVLTRPTSLRKQVNYK